MAKMYTIVKKNSTDHLAALDSRFVANREIIPVGTTHVLIPSIRRVNFGHSVSHAKNRVNSVRWSNVATVHVDMNGASQAIRLSNGDLRTYNKVLGQGRE